jgi:hypothetical protein
MKVDIERAFDNYFPVIEAARKVKAHYMGKVPLICSDVVGELLTELIKADNNYMIGKEEI